MVRRYTWYVGTHGTRYTNKALTMFVIKLLFFIRVSFCFGLYYHIRVSFLFNMFLSSFTDHIQVSVH